MRRKIKFFEFSARVRLQRIFNPRTSRSFFKFFVKKINTRLRVKKYLPVEYYCTRESTKSYGEEICPFNFKDTQFLLEKKVRRFKKNSSFSKINDEIY